LARGSNAFPSMESLVFRTKDNIKQILGLLVQVSQSKSKSSLSKQLQIRNILTQISHLQQNEQQLVCISALHSIARRERCSPLRQRLHQFYQNLCINVSQGLTNNLWRLINVSEDKTNQRLLSGVASSVPSSKIARNF
jgi:hypothetical protein